MVNETILVGRMTRDAQLKTVNGSSYAHFTMALDRAYGKDKATDFIPCTAWNATADNLCKYCGKGSLIAVIGSIHTRSYENSEGQKVNAFEVVANRIQFLDSKKSKDSAQMQTYSPGMLESLDELDPLTDDDVQF